MTRQTTSMKNLKDKLDKYQLGKARSTRPIELHEGSPVTLELTADRRNALLTRGNTPTMEIDSLFAQQVADFIDQYRPALEALAK